MRQGRRGARRSCDVTDRSGALRRQSVSQKCEIKRMQPVTITKTPSWLTDTAWLQDRLGLPDIAVVDASYCLPAAKRDPYREYLNAHIPGAVFFDVDLICDKTTDLPHMLPSAQDF